MIAALLLAGSAAAAAPATCPVERAEYTLRGQPGFIAEFHPAASNRDWPSGLVLAIHARKTGRTYWFLPWNGGTDGRMHVRWIRVTGDKLDGKSITPDQDFLGTDAAYGFTAAVPTRRGKAPAHFVLPGFARQLWHATAIDERDDMEQAFFDLTACGAQANAAVNLKLPPIS